MNTHILVTGAPGNVGTEVVQQLQAQGVAVRVGAFNPIAARRVFNENTEITHFDFLKPETYASTFVGIERLFLVRPPALSNVKRDIAPAIWAAKKAGVQQIVFLSIQGVEENGQAGRGCRSRAMALFGRRIVCHGQRLSGRWRLRRAIA